MREQVVHRYTLKRSSQQWSVALKVEKWGDSLAVRLPAGLLEALELLEGDLLQIVIDGLARPLCPQYLGSTQC